MHVTLPAREFPAPRTQPAAAPLQRVRWWVGCFVAGLAMLVVATPVAGEPEIPHSSRLTSKKSTLVEEPDLPPLLATLVQTHSGEHVLLDRDTPENDRFSGLLADRVTGARRSLDTRLLELLRRLSERHQGPQGPPRVELVSGFRSEKLNEMLRKKGHRVASRSQHSLGHACDFRLVLPGAERGIDPRALEAEIREMGFTGGVGVYRSKNDWFVHTDVGRNRRWDG